jgi:hypothetical protein
MQSVNVKEKKRQIQKHAITENDCDPLFERKIQNATEGLNLDCLNWLNENKRDESTEK